VAPNKATDLAGVLAQIQSGVFVLTAQFEGKRAGVVVRSVQPCADEPPLLCVAVRRGHWIEPIVRDSHAFAICKSSAADRLLLRKFAETSRPRDGDPFDCVPLERLATGAPVLSRSPHVLDCEVLRHFDLEADHELYIGHVLAARVGAAGEPGTAVFQAPLALAADPRPRLPKP
jgi:flavin reductase (DIM6/NTAB) family NADH-FMN oxidoreductase RutF